MTQKLLMNSPIGMLVKYIQTLNICSPCVTVRRYSRTRGTLEIGEGAGRGTKGKLNAPTFVEPTWKRGMVFSARKPSMSLTTSWRDALLARSHMYERAEAGSPWPADSASRAPCARERKIPNLDKSAKASQLKKLCKFENMTKSGRTHLNISARSSSASTVVAEAPNHEDGELHRLLTVRRERQPLWDRELKSIGLEENTRAAGEPRIGLFHRLYFGTQRAQDSPRRTYAAIAGQIFLKRGHAIDPIIGEDKYVEERVHRSFNWRAAIALSNRGTRGSRREEARQEGGEEIGEDTEEIEGVPLDRVRVEYRATPEDMRRVRDLSEKHRCKKGSEAWRSMRGSDGGIGGCWVHSFGQRRDTSSLGYALRGYCELDLWVQTTEDGRAGGPERVDCLAVVSAGGEIEHLPRRTRSKVSSTMHNGDFHLRCTRARIPDSGGSVERGESERWWCGDKERKLRLWNSNSGTRAPATGDSYPARALILQPCHTGVEPRRVHRRTRASLSGDTTHKALGAVGGALHVLNGEAVCHAQIGITHSSAGSVDNAQWGLVYPADVTDVAVARPRRRRMARVRARRRAIVDSSLVIPHTRYWTASELFCTFQGNEIFTVKQWGSRLSQVGMGSKAVVGGYADGSHGRRGLRRLRDRTTHSTTDSVGDTQEYPAHSVSRRVTTLAIVQVSCGTSHTHQVLKTPVQGTNSGALCAVCSTSPTPCQPYALPALRPASPTPCQPYALPALRPASPTPCQPYALPALSPTGPTPYQPYALPPLLPTTPTPYALPTLDPRTTSWPYPTTLANIP
ncbi:hypothetical protein FA13DRAFT_1721621 [Coprinellus micaceus]|uniref:Uncharacterized protein n=1 Tax=Coprinellus micaceus TaxID=71717 RepID=A0A4Y7RZT9_COPMI|nr:hypothetical protein FA13DRAFT_1721621 [Coprinellus micaceus]